MSGPTTGAIVAAIIGGGVLWYGVVLLLAKRAAPTPAEIAKRYRSAIEDLLRAGKPDGDAPPFVVLTAEQAVQSHDWRTRRSAAGAWCFGAVPDYEVCRRCGLSKHYLETRAAPPRCGDA